MEGRTLIGTLMYGGTLIRTPDVRWGGTYRNPYASGDTYRNPDVRVEQASAWFSSQPQISTEALIFSYGAEGHNE